jgi:hypothetical protein
MKTAISDDLRSSMVPTFLRAPRSTPLRAVLDRRPLSVCGIGAIFSDTTHHGADPALELVERLLDQAASDGAALALLFGK